MVYTGFWFIEGFNRLHCNGPITNSLCIVMVNMLAFSRIDHGWVQTLVRPN
jgi:hypothetical protein